MNEQAPLVLERRDRNLRTVQELVNAWILPRFREKLAGQVNLNLEVHRRPLHRC